MSKNDVSGFHEKEFKELLRKGIGSRTQQEFATKTGIAPATISRMLNDNGIPCPRIKTLETFAANMVNVSLSELLTACGYQAPDIKDIVIKIESNVDDFFQLKADELDIYGNIEKLKNKLLKFLDKDDLKLTIKDRKYTEADQTAGFQQVWPSGAEDSKIFELTWEYDHYVCKTSFSVYYIETMKGNMILVGSDIAYILHDSDEYVQNTLVKEKKKCTQEARLLHAIFGTENDKTLPETYAGYGFYLDGIPDGFVDFLNKHADTFCYTKENMKLYCRVMNGEPAEEVFAEYWDCNESCMGVCAVISDIMSLETGKGYLYYEPDEKLPKEAQNSCIMERFPYDIVDRIEKEQLKYIYQCARELKIQKFGVVYYHTTIQEETEQLYNLDSFYLC